MNIKQAIALIEDALTAEEHNILRDFPEAREAWELVKGMAQDGWDRS
jgi:hypothetical protein